MKLRKIGVERYKSYAEPTEMEIAPLTILAGWNNSGKSALAQAIPLVACGLSAPAGEEEEPLLLASHGIQHGRTFEDLVTERRSHGALQLSVTLANRRGETSFRGSIRNVTVPGQGAEQQISEWQLRNNEHEIVAARKGWGETANYQISVPGRSPVMQPVAWDGLRPKDPGALAEWIDREVEELRYWASGVRYLGCPRRLGHPPFSRTLAWRVVAALRGRINFGVDGRNTPGLLAADSELYRAVRDWYQKAFNVRMELAEREDTLKLMTGTPLGSEIEISQAGQGLSQVLPVAITALWAGGADPGVDIIEYPEAELHPAAQAELAELMLENLSGPIRPLIITTHSEMILLRARRWIAEQRLPAEHVLVYWVQTVPGRGSVVEKIRIREDGEMETWPEGVFAENYEEILAIRRGAREKVMANSASKGTPRE